MGTPLSLLIVEDADSDALLMVGQLRAEGFDVAHQRVETAAQMRAALGARTWDLVLADFNIPGYGAAPALALLRELKPDVPLIVVSGVVGEQAAVELMKAGARDIVMKDHLARLGPAVHRELADADERAARRRVEDELRASLANAERSRRAMLGVLEDQRRAEQALRESEERFRSLTELSSDWYWEQDRDFRAIGYADGGTRRSEISARPELGARRWDVPALNLSDADWAQHRAVLERHEAFRDFEIERRGKDGGTSWISLSGAPVFDAAGNFKGYRGVGRNITERKRAEGDLARFAAIVEGSEDAILSTDSGGTLLTWNPAAERMFGYSVEEAIGRDVAFLVPLEEREAMEHRRSLIAEGCTVPPFDAVRLAKDGRRIDVMITLSLIQASHGKPVVVSLIMHDITERKHAEGDLARLAAIVGGSGEAIVSRDLEGRILTWNPAAERIFGYGAAEIIGRDIETLIPKGTRQADGRRRSLVEQGRGQETFDAVRIAKDGRRINVSISLSPVRDASGAVIAVSLIMRNIDERKRQERALAESEERFRGLVEQSIAGICIIQDGKFAYVNPRFAEIRGCRSSEALIGRDSTTMVAEKDRGPIAETHRRLLAGEMQSASFTFTGLREDGSAVEVGASIARATYQGRLAIIGMLQDISEKKRAEEQIQRHTAQLEAAFMSTVQVATKLSERRDPYTAGHARRVGEVAVAIGADLGFDARAQEGLRVAGYLHDVGKITIPVEILAKPGRLEPMEFELIKGHAEASYDILKEVAFPWPLAQVAWQHHERMDGSGYPRGLKGDAILLEARILAVADVVEAMASDRPYRAGLGIDRALAEIERGRGSVYDAAVADACLRLFRDKGYAIPT